MFVARVSAKVHRVPGYFSYLFFRLVHLQSDAEILVSWRENDGHVDHEVGGRMAVVAVVKRFLHLSRFE